MNRDPRAREGYVPVPGGRVWYRIVGAGDATPVLTLHGGPGGGHDYFEPLEALAADRPVVLYDQLGCGRSDHPEDTSLWRIERFVEEVDAVRRGLGLERIHLLGHSWGGWVAIDYMLGRPRGVVALVLASTSASIPQVAAETARLKAALPPEVLAVMERCEAAGQVHAPEYEEAVMAFYRRHVCRLDPWPEPLVRSGRNRQEALAVYETIWGPNEFTVTGNLRDWDRSDRLGQIAVPTLVTCGRHDELGPPCARVLHRGLPRAEMHVFEGSVHSAHLEEPEGYLALLREFLARADRQG